jgi:hypothetical protein
MISNLKTLQTSRSSCVLVIMVLKYISVGNHGKKYVRRRIKDNVRNLSVRLSVRVFQILYTKFPKGFLLVLIAVNNK